MKHLLTAFALAFLAASATPADDGHSKPLTLLVAPQPCAALEHAAAAGAARHAPRQRRRSLPPGDPEPEAGRPADEELESALEQWMAAPLKDFPRDDVAKFLKPCELTFREVEAGARSEDCNWGLTEELRKNGLKGFDAILPSIFDMRRDRGPAHPASPF